VFYLEEVKAKGSITTAYNIVLGVDINSFLDTGTYTGNLMLLGGIMQQQR